MEEKQNETIVHNSNITTQIFCNYDVMYFYDSQYVRKPLLYVGTNEDCTQFRSSKYTGHKKRLRIHRWVILCLTISNFYG